MANNDNKFSYDDLGKNLGNTIDNMMKNNDFININNTIQKAVDMALNETKNSFVGKTIDKMGSNISGTTNDYTSSYKNRNSFSEVKSDEMERYAIKPVGLVQNIIFIIALSILSFIFLLISLILRFQNISSYSIFAIFSVLSIIGIVIFSLKLGRLFRFKKYTSAVSRAGFCDIKEMSTKMGISQSKIVSEINYFIKKGNYPEGRIVESDSIFIISNSIFNLYMDSLKSRQKVNEMQESIKENKELEAFLEKSRMQIEEISSLEKRINDPDMITKIDSVIKSIQNIVETIKQQPQQLGVLDRFSSYYVPTTLKLIESYSDLEMKGIETESSKQAKIEIKNAIDTIVIAYNKLLDQIIKVNTMDVNADISVLRLMLSQDGLNDNEPFRNK